MTGLLIVGLVGLGIGIWFGLPGRDRPSVEDIERAIEQGGGAPRRRRSKRAVNPMAWVARKAQAKPSHDRRTRTVRRSFSLESPEEREKD